MENKLKATAPPLVDARHTTKSYLIAYELLKALRRRNPESMVEVTFQNDKGLLKDIGTWCEVTGNRLLSSESSLDGHDVMCLIQKSMVTDRRGSIVSSIDAGRSVCVLIATADLEDVILSLDKALSGAVLGMVVHLYFEGPGVFLLRKGYRAIVSGLFGKFRTSRVESSISEKGGLLPGGAIEVLQELGAQFYVRGPSLEEFGVREEEIMVRNFIVASTMTWIELMARSDVHVG